MLRQHLSDDVVFQIIDESYQHEGHGGYNPEVGVTHVAIEIICDSFTEMPLVERQRLINSWMDDFFKKGLHAVRYRLKTTNENMPL